ncbi:MAG: methyltransferase domain-containing protein [Burkholderiales bacterium]|nr:methyltransferase domain-containing protein [Burkholderiales bacterium]
MPISLSLTAGQPAAEPEVRDASLAKYRRRAGVYDLTCGPTWPIRRRAVAGLGLKPGERVLDVACGTGLSLGLLREGVGTEGKVVGFDHSPEMLERARAKVAAAGWQNVEVHHAFAQGMTSAEQFDALLFHYTHDILRSEVALDAILACAKPGARVAIAGIKYFPRYLAPLNWWVYWKNCGYNGRPGELATPWDRIAPRLSGWRMEATQWGMGYLAVGHLPGRAADPAPGVAEAPARVASAAAQPA